MERKTEKVWYASYGSNLCFERFLCYIFNTDMVNLETNLTSKHTGCRTRIRPEKTLPCLFPFPCFFASYSSFWNGSIAFLSLPLSSLSQTQNENNNNNNDNKEEKIKGDEKLNGENKDIKENCLFIGNKIGFDWKDNKEEELKDWLDNSLPQHNNNVNKGKRNFSYGRMYLITAEQFIDILIQENDFLTTKLPHLSVEDIVARYQLSSLNSSPSPSSFNIYIEEINSDPYNLLVVLGFHDCYPIITFTTNFLSPSISKPLIYQSSDLNSISTPSLFSSKKNILYHPPSPAYVNIIYKGLKDTYSIPGLFYLQLLLFILYFLLSFILLLL